MRIRSETPLPWDAARVALACRDQVPEIGRYVAGVDGIDTVRRTDGETGAALVHRWRPAGAPPPLARKVWGEAPCAWEQDVQWAPDLQQARFVIRTAAYADAVHAAGRWEVQHAEAGALLVVDAEVRVALQALPGFPRFLHATLAPPLAQWLRDSIATPLAAWPAGVARFLEEGA